MTKPQAISVTAPVNEDLPKEKFDELEEFINNLETTKGALIRNTAQSTKYIWISTKGCSTLYCKKIGYSGCRSFWCCKLLFLFYYKTQRKTYN